MVSRSGLAWTVAIGFLAALLPAASVAQSGRPFNGLYRVVGEQGDGQSLVRLELIQAAGGRVLAVATIFSPTAPRFQVMAGIVDRGGLNIHFARLLEARNPYQLLKRPALILMNPHQVLKQGFTCQIDFYFAAPGEIPYACSSDDGSRGGIGRLVRLRD